MASEEGQAGSVEESRGCWTALLTCRRNWILIFGAALLIFYFSGLQAKMGKKVMHFIFARFLSKFQHNFNRALGKHKEELFSGISRDFGAVEKLQIVEIGAGAGANFKFFPKGSRISCIEPNDMVEKALRKSVEETNGAVTLEEFRVGKAENMSHLKDNSVDAVVCSLVMCSVDSVDGTLKEVKRVLKPGGKFYFIEHTVAEEGSQGRIYQLMLLNLMRFLLHKNINREAYVNIYRAGFSDVKMEFFDAPSLKEHAPWFFRPFVATRHFQGTATK